MERVGGWGTDRVRPFAALRATVRRGEAAHPTRASPGGEHRSPQCGQDERRRAGRVSGGGGWRSSYESLRTSGGGQAG